MALTPSTMLPLGTKAPQFRLPDISGKTVSLADLPASRGVLIMFICNHCPYVKHVRAELARIGSEYPAKGIAVVGISSNDVVQYPADSLEKMKEEAAEAGYTFPYLLDETQEVAKAYKAACTPDFFLFDAEQRLVYRGQLDETRPKTGQTPTGKDLRAALDALIAGGPVPDRQIPSTGCNIKWKPGAEPDYFHIKS